MNADKNVLYSAFSQRPKHLDPARSYSSDEYRFIGQIYEPPLQYHYLIRPYKLEPLSASAMPTVRYYDRAGVELPKDAAAGRIAYTDYEITLRKGMRYQPHPALAVDERGKPRYLSLAEADLDNVHRLADFEHQGTREVVAADFVHQLKRLAHPATHSPILSLMQQYILGLDALQQRLQTDYKSNPDLKLGDYTLQGVTELDRYRYRIRIKGSYPQFIYWLAMPFFAPVPPEVDVFYAQPGMKQRNLSLDWYPLGSGAYLLAENNPNRQMVLARNPNYHGDHYPHSGNAEDKANGLLNDAGRVLPMIDRAIYTLEKETIPKWSKFLQGYYDASTISSDNFDQAVQMGSDGGFGLTAEMRDKGIELKTAVAASVYYFGFNWLDKVVGGNSERARKLRLAISIAVDYDEFIQIFQNGRGVAAQGPLPPGIVGRREAEAGINPHVYEWRDDRSQPRLQRRPLADALRLMEQAGYAGGIDPATGKPLVLNYDAYVSSGADAKARLDWYRKQFRKLGIRLVVRSTDYNRFRDKMSKGNAQMFSWGWNADYPDPENFFFLLTSAQSKVAHQGENASNYSNPAFDALFAQMKNLPNGEKRQDIIDRMMRILRDDAPWLWGYHPKDFTLHHGWLKNVKPNLMAHNTLKYQRLQPQSRQQLQVLWNSPIVAPLYGLLLLGVVLLVPLVVVWRRRAQRRAHSSTRPGAGP